MKRVLEFVRNLLRQTNEATPSSYRDGYQAALEDVEEWIEDELWEKGDEV